MASERILEEKKKIVSEITDKIQNSESVILFQYQGLTVRELTELRNKLRDVNAEIKVYKNTLLKLACDGLNIDITEFLEGPNAILFGADLLEPIKVISEYAKKNNKLDIRVGVLSGSVSDKSVIAEYAAIPSREGLLTMLAGGMIGTVRDLSICLDLYSKEKEEN